MLVKKFLDIALNYDVIIFDAYGVFSFSHGIEPRAAETMKELRKRGKKVFILSNSEAVAVELEHHYFIHGLLKGVHYDKLVSSGEYACTIALQGALPMPGTKMYVLGTANFRQPEDKTPDLFKGSIYTVTADLQDADFVYIGVPQINGEDRIMLEDFMPEIVSCLRLNKPMLCCNPDRRANEGGRFVIRPGMIYQIYTLLGGKAEIYGKPDPKIFEFLLKDVAVNRQNILMVGDTLQTDISGAKSAGIHSCLTLLGGMEEYLLSERGKTMTGKNLQNRFAETGIYPDYVVSAIY